MTHARIIFIPGLNPKPPADLYREQLTRVLLSSLRAARPRAAEWLAANPDAFVPVAWTYLFYGAHRDITMDLPGIERLLTQPGPSEQDLLELKSWRRRLLRATHRIGDAWPLLGRRFAPATTRRLLHEANRYLKNRDGVGATVRNVLREMIEAAWRDGDSVLLLGHSLGSVIAYETLWELTHVHHVPGKLNALITLGSPLGTRFVQRSLLSGRAEGAARYPHNIGHWVNMTARSDTTALQARLKPLFHEMLDLGLCDAIEDFVDFDNYFRGAIGLNPHEAYGYLAQPLVAEVIGDWLERFS